MTAVLIEEDIKSCLLHDQQLYEALTIAFTNGVIHFMNEM